MLTLWLEAGVEAISAARAIVASIAPGAGAVDASATPDCATGRRGRGAGDPGDVGLRGGERGTIVGRARVAGPDGGNDGQVARALRVDGLGPRGRDHRSSARGGTRRLREHRPGRRGRRPGAGCWRPSPSAPTAMPPIKQERDAAGEPRRTAARVRRGRAEQPADAVQERAAGRRHRDVMRRARSRERSDSRSASAVGVGDRIAAQADGEIVAAVLALDADPAREPPDRRMIEEHRLDERLQQVHQVVVAADVRELVRENRLELLRRERRERARREQHDRLQPADHGRHVDQRRLEQRDRAA